MDHFEYRDGCYYAEDVALPALAQTVGTPFYCYSDATLTRHYQVFSEHFPDARICFAVKANGNLAVLHRLGQLGCGADVVSEGEIRLALAAGIPAEHIVFSGVGKQADEMGFALEQGIFQFNVESEPELLLLSETAQRLGKVAPIALRVNPDVDAKTHAKISTGQKSSKFGIPMSDALPLYHRASKMPGIRVQSVSVHIGSQLTHLAPFEQAFVRVRAFVEQLRAEGIPIPYVDLGGGLGIPYGKEAPPLPAAYAEMVHRVMQGLDCRLIFEPGRVLVGNAGVLVTRVLYVKRSEGKIFVIVDAAMNDLIRPTLYEAYHEIVPVMPRPEAATELVDVVGPVCETGDVFAEQRLMKLPEPGDLLVLRSAGAYGAVMSSTYNARLSVPEVMVRGADVAVVRSRPNYEDLIARDRLPHWG